MGDRLFHAWIRVKEGGWLLFSRFLFLILMAVMVPV